MASSNIVSSYKFKINDIRVLTAVTKSAKVAAKWLAEAAKIKNAGRNLVVGLAVGKQSKMNSRFESLTISTGSSCLVYVLPEVQENVLDATKSLDGFLNNPRVTSVGKNMESLLSSLQNYHGIVIAHGIDLRTLVAENAKKRNDCVDLFRCGLEDLVAATHGKKSELLKVELMEIDGDMASAVGPTAAEVEKATLYSYVACLLGAELLKAGTSK